MSKPFLNPQKPDRIIDQLLLRTKFDYSTPDPALAWTVFKEFLHIRVGKLKCKIVGFECVHESERNVVFLSFFREFEAPIGYCGCAFAHPVTQQLRKVSVNNWCWPKQGNLRDWQNDVEGTGAFRVAMRLRNWKWLGHRL